MNEPFVPLNKNAMPGQNRTGFRVSIVSDAENSAPSIRWAMPEARPAPAANAKPQVTLQRDGERVSAIRIQCGCGQVIELACVYEKAKG